MACACLGAQMVSELTLWSSSLYFCVFWGLNSDCQARTGSPFICGTILQTSLNIYLKRCALARPSCLRSTAPYASLEYCIHYIPSMHCVLLLSLPLLLFLYYTLSHCCCECHSYLLIINYNAMRTLIRFCVCPGTGRGSVFICVCSLISTNPPPSSKCQSYIRIANSGD